MADNNLNDDELAELMMDTSKPITWNPVTTPAVRSSNAIRRIRQVEFLKAFAEVGTVKRACEVAQINRRTHNNWLAIDGWYRQQFQDAVINYRDTIQDELHARALTGVEVPIIGKRPVEIGVKANGDPVIAMQDEIIGHKTVKDPLLLMFLAKKVDPSYRDNAKSKEDDDTPKDTISPITRLQAKLDQMEQRKQVELREAASQLPEMVVPPEPKESSE